MFTLVLLQTLEEQEIVVREHNFACLCVWSCELAEWRASPSRNWSASAVPMKNDFTLIAIAEPNLSDVLN